VTVERVPETGLALEGYALVRRGCGPEGWSRAPTEVHRCAACGYVMRADNVADFACTCGAMRLDADAGRFGSRLGDDNVLTYRRLGS
jgi:hypothetical protein